MKSRLCRNAFLPVAMIVFSMLLISGCNSGDNNNLTGDPVNPWLKTATAATWLTTNPFDDKHDGGWVYSAREDLLYAIYGNVNDGTTLYRIDHIGNTSSVATTFNYNRHGAHPVIDNTGTYIYMPPSGSSSTLERYDTVADTLETLATAPDYGEYSHGAWKNGMLWIVLDDFNLYSYDPVGDAWSSPLYTFSDRANVATSGPASDLIYIIVDSGDFYSYDVVTDTIDTLPAHPNGFTLGGNSQFTWFGSEIGFIYAADGFWGTDPAIYDIYTDTWHALSDPKISDGWSGHATYDSFRRRLYVTGTDDEVWYYQY